LVDGALKPRTYCQGTGKPAGFLWTRNSLCIQFVLLACAWWLNNQGEHPNQPALATQAGTDVKMASQVLRALEAKGLIEREVDPADTRAKRLRVTSAGAELAPRAIAAVEFAEA